MRPTEERERKIKWLRRYKTYKEIHRIYSNEYYFWNDVSFTYEEANKTHDHWLAMMTGAKEATLCFMDWADKTACVCAEIYSAIMPLESDEALILTLRYIEGLRWDVISEKCNLSKRQIFRIHNKALDNLNIVQAEKRPPSLRYASDYLFHYASSTNVVGGETPVGNLLKGDPDEVFAD